MGFQCKLDEITFIKYIKKVTFSKKFPYIFFLNYRQVLENLFVHEYEKSEYITRIIFQVKYKIIFIQNLINISTAPQSWNLLLPCCDFLLPFYFLFEMEQEIIIKNTFLF